MPKSAKLLFVLTDGGRARFVERPTPEGAYETVDEIDATARLAGLRRALRASPRPRTISSTSPARSTIGPEDDITRAKEAFADEVADRAAGMCQSRALDGVVVAAPARLVGRLRARLEGRVHLAGSVRKNLTKTPDHELGAWFDTAPFNSRAQG